MGCSRSNAGMADSQAAEETGKVLNELTTVIRLDAVKGKGQRLEKSRQGATDGFHGPALQDRGHKIATAVVHQRELEAFVRKVLDIHLSSLSWVRLRVTRPDRLAFAGPTNEGPTATQDAVEAAQTARNAIGLA